MKTKLKPFTIKKATSRPEIIVKAERFQSKKWNPSTLPNVSASKVVDNKPKIQLEVSQFEKDLMRDSYAEFVKKFWSTIVQEELVWNWHMDEICSRMQWGIMRNIRGLPCEKDLLINISPGTSKSLLTSVMSVAWAWTIKPSLKFICSSYNEDLAFELAGRCRDVVQSVMYQEYFPHVRIREDKNKVSNFATTAGGARMATGITSITGFHAHIIIVDDPINPKSTDSAKELENANKFMSKTLISRMVDKETTFTCLVMQRLHQDDPSARMIKEGRCRKLILPALDTFPIFPPKLKMYYRDGLMDCNRLTYRYLNRMKRAESMGEYAFAGQYGQSPAPPSGGMFKIDRFRDDWDHPAMQLPVTERCRFWDKAGTIKGGAYTVGALLVKRGTEKDGGPFFAVEDVIRVQLDSYARNQLIVSTAKEDGLKTIVGLEQEGGSGGKESLETSIRGLHGFVVKWLKPIRDKELRADAYSSQVNGGNVWLAHGRSWVEEFKEEHKYFPYSTYKDQVDAVSSAFTIIATRRKKKVGGFSAFSKLRQG